MDCRKDKSTNDGLSQKCFIGFHLQSFVGFTINDIFLITHCFNYVWFLCPSNLDSKRISSRSDHETRLSFRSYHQFTHLYHRHFHIESTLEIYAFHLATHFWDWICQLNFTLLENGCRNYLRWNTGLASWTMQSYSNHFSTYHFIATDPFVLDGIGKITLANS